MSADGGPGADAVTGPGPVTVEIEDICGPATFRRLPEALAATWEALRLLPLGAVQAGAFRHFLTHPEVDRLVRESIRREGRIEPRVPAGRPGALRPDRPRRDSPAALIDTRPCPSRRTG